MSDCAACNPSIDCPADEMFPYSLTGNSVFPFIIICPTGNCFTAPEVSMFCCGQEITAVMPTGATQEEREARIQTLLSQCQSLITGCTGGDSPTPTPPGTSFFLSAALAVSRTCANDAGIYRYTLESGRFIAGTQSAANAQALAYANQVLADNAICFNPPHPCLCAGVESSLRGGLIGAHGPFTMQFVSGYLPVSLSLSGGVVRFTGTPVAPGTFQAQLKFTDSIGGVLTVDLTLRVALVGYQTTLAALFTAPLVGASAAATFTSATNAKVGAIVRLSTVAGGITNGQYGTYEITNVASNIVTLKNLTATPGVSISPSSGSTASWGLVQDNVPEFSQGESYSFQLPAVGGSGTYTFAITVGDLPTGLSMSTTGLITGTPTDVEDEEFTVVATDTWCSA